MGQNLGWVLNVNEYVFPSVRPSYDENHELLVRFSSPGGDAEIPAMLVLPRQLALRPRDIRDGYGEQVGVCVLYFHPNAVDIGDCVPDLYNIRDGVFKGDAVMLAPEYCGYGLLHDYKPSVETIDVVASASWKYCRKVLGFSAEQIVLWGRSIGTGPACMLAQSRAKKNAEKPKKSRNLGALVLIAPMINMEEVIMWHTNSAIIASLVGPMWKLDEMVKEEGLVDVPICVVHPRDDEIIPCSHGEFVLESCSSKKKFCLWIAGATHNFQMQVEHFVVLQDFLLKHVGVKKKRRATCPGSSFYGQEHSDTRTSRGSDDRRASEGRHPSNGGASSAFRCREGNDAVEEVVRSAPAPKRRLSPSHLATQSVVERSGNENEISSSEDIQLEHDSELARRAMRRASLIVSNQHVDE